MVIFQQTFLKNIENFSELDILFEVDIFQETSENGGRGGGSGRHLARDGSD